MYHTVCRPGPLPSSCVTNPVLTGLLLQVGFPYSGKGLKYPEVTLGSGVSEKSPVSDEISLVI